MQDIHFSKFVKKTPNIDNINIAIIILAWIITVILVNPIGNFPLNDDWAYAESVKLFLETGIFQLPGWAVANLFPQAFWGWLFCLPLGFSFTALRFSTLTLGLAGVIVTYCLIKEISSSPKIALLGAFLIAVNPIYFALSNTFMTDVPHYTLSILSVYIFCLGLKQDSLSKIGLATFVALIALLIRQVTAALFVGYLLAYIFKYRAKIRSIVISVLLFVGIPGIVQSGFASLFWPKDFGHYGTKEQKFVEQITEAEPNLIGNFIYFGLCALLYLGCFLLPFLILAFCLKYSALKSRLNKKLFVSLFLCLTSAIAFWLISNRQRMPIAGNVIDNWGIGPLTLRDSLLPSSESLPNYLGLFWLVVTICSIIGAALLLGFLILSIIQLFFDRQISWEKRSLILVNGSIGVIYFFPLGLSFFFDRYLLLLLPLSIVMVIHFLGDIDYAKLSLQNSWLSFVLIFAIAIFTVSATHDYLHWNRIRWQAIEVLTQEQAVSANNIDGGFEYNGWHLYSPEYKRKKRRKQGKAWWWVAQDDYVISFTPIEGYDVTKKYLLNSWLPFKSDYILVSQKKADITK